MTKYSSNNASPKYRCTVCGASGVKLWRQYNTLASCVQLMCAGCASKNQGVKNTTGRNGTHYDAKLGARIDQIGSLVPAVPTEDDETYWGYTSVPQDGCDWWGRLPVRSRKRNK